MSSPRRGASFDSVNEGHVAAILMRGAVESVLDESTEPLSVPQVVSRLVSEGYPAGDCEALQVEVKAVLASHPDTFAKTSNGWVLSAADLGLGPLR